MSELFKPAPKKFQFSSKLNKEIIEQRVADVADLTGATASEVMENALIERLLPHDEHASRYVNCVLFGRKCYMGDDEWFHYGIRLALGDIFNEVSAGANWRPARTNAKPLVEFASELIDEHGPKLVKRKQQYPTDLDELDYAFDSFCSLLETQAKRNEIPELEGEAKRARELIYPAIRDAKIEPGKIMDIILRNWTAVENSTHTFRTLHWLFMALSDWEDTADNRARFQSLCEEVMSEWTADDEREATLKEQAKVEAQMINYPMADGAYVSVPRGWVAVNLSVSPNARYAGVVEIKHGERYNAPHFLFFLEDHPVGEMTSEETAEIKTLAAKTWPDFKQVEADVVPLRHSSDGGVANLAEHSAAPQIGFFPIFERGEYPLGRPPYGAEIVRPSSESAERS